MNERIEKLAKQADLIEFEPIGDSDQYTPNHTSVVKAQKFAQLIVAECAEIALTDGQATGNFEVFNKITKHFGVKE